VNCEKVQVTLYPDIIARYKEVRSVKD